MGTEGERVADVVKEVAQRMGLTEADVAPCYASTESYQWCLALLGVSNTPPISPLPPDLVGLALKLAMLGRLDYGRARVLGIDKVVMRLVAERLGRAVRMAADPVLRYGRYEIAEELAKARELFRTASRVADPRAVEEVVQSVRRVAPAVPEELVLKALTGRESPTALAEELARAVKPAEAPRGEEVVKERRVAAPVPEHVPTGRAQPPREG